MWQIWPKMRLPMPVGIASLLYRCPMLLLLSGTVGACAMEQTVSPAAKRNALDAFALAVPDNPSCAELSTVAGIDRYCVSSVLPKDDVNVFYYGPKSLFDHADHTAWVEGVDGQGIGEWIAVDFDHLRLINAIEINNGYNKGAELYLKNSRVKKLTVEFFQNDKRTVVLNSIELKDNGAPQHVSLPKDQVLKATKVKFTIESVYPGTKFDDTAISELHISSEATQP
jgi:Nicotine adenine dinucleotide glycohydrolase (NADase)